MSSTLVRGLSCHPRRFAVARDVGFPVAMARDGGLAMRGVPIEAELRGRNASCAVSADLPLTWRLNQVQCR
jgi:hypothetical protein